MNYQAAYDRLIAKARARAKPESYTERHHVVPKSLGGSNDASNLVDLTAREHFVAHLLLAKWLGGKMWLAVNYCTQGQKINSRTFEVIRQNMAAVVSELRTEYFLDVANREKHSVATKAAQNTMQARKNNSESKLKVWAQPEKRAVLKARAREVSDRPQVREYRSRTAKARMEDAAYKKNISDKNKVSNLIAQGKKLNITMDDGKELEFFGLKPAARLLGVNVGNFAAKCRGVYAHALKCKAPGYEGRKIVSASYA